MIGKDFPVWANAFLSSSEKRIRSAAVSPADTLCFDIFSPPPGDTLWAQSRFIAKDQTLRNFILNEPRGGVYRHINLLVPPKNPPHSNLTWRALCWLVRFMQVTGASALAG